MPCRKCQHPQSYGNMRHGNRVREDFAFVCECGCSVIIPYKSVVLTADPESGQFILNMPAKVTCNFCKKEMDVPA